MTDRLYTISELGRELGLTARALRFYEDKGLIAPRRAGNTRVYTQRDRARLILIQRGKRLGFSLSEIREYLDLYDADITQRAQIAHLHAAVSARLEKLLQQREALEQSIAELSEIRRQAEAALAAQREAAQRAAD
jgi:DNA-binding transcriptional MerR regulator